MQLRVLALDFDGTITENDRVDPDVRAAIGEARKRGLKVVLATGRRMAHLRETAGDLAFVDAIVAENGAVISFPDSGEATVLAPRTSEKLLGELRRRQIPFEAGEVVVDCDAGAARLVLEIIREQQLPLVLLFNRDRLMVLPQGISKATGLRHLLDGMRLSPHNAVSIGDAENDHELLSVCELGVAVRWGSPALIAAADDVVEGRGPSAVAAYIRTLMQSRRISPALLRRRKLLVGMRDDASPVSLCIKGRNLLIVGDPRSGKSWVAGLLAEQLVLQGYSLCIIDPEGDYEGLEALPEVIGFGGDEPPPRPRELTRALRHADFSLVINLSRLVLEEKRRYVHELLQMLAALRQSTGLPHRIFIDEAHYFLSKDCGPQIDVDLAGYTLVSYRTRALDPSVITATEAVILTRSTDREELVRLLGARSLSEEWMHVLASLQTGEAVLVPGIDEIDSEPVRVRLAARRTYHVRHLLKYVDVPIADYHAFVFTRNGRGFARARSLGELAAILSAQPPAAVDGHLRRNDFSRWIADVYGDLELAAAVGEIEKRYCHGLLPDVTGTIAAAVRDRYATPAAA